MYCGDKAQFKTIRLLGLSFNEYLGDMVVGGGRAEQVVGIANDKEATLFRHIRRVQNRLYLRIYFRLISYNSN